MSKSPNALFLNAVLFAALVGGAYLMTHNLDQAQTRPAQPPAPVKSTGSIVNLDTKTIAPDFKLTDINGKTFSLHEHKGKVILLNFWATWCAPCIVEFPQLIQLAKDNPDDFVLIALSSDIDAQKIESFLEKHDIPAYAGNIIIAMDNEQNITGNLYQTYALPESILMDKNLQMRTKIIGANWQRSDLQALIEILANPS